jgi:hypothetical protein
VSISASSNTNLSGYIVLQGTISSTICDYNQTVEKEIYIGKPTLSNPTISGLNNVSCSSTYIYDFFGNIEGIYDTRWIVSPQFDDVSSVNGTKLFVDPTNGGEGYVTFVAYNQCGEAVFCKPVEVSGHQCDPYYLIIPNPYSCEDAGRVATYKYHIFPNPTNYLLTIEDKEITTQNDSTSNDEKEVKYELFDFNYILKTTGSFKTKIDLDLSGYNKGQYILRLTFGENSESHHIIIN